MVLAVNDKRIVKEIKEDAKNLHPVYLLNMEIN